MAKILSITDGARFRLALRASAGQAAALDRPKAWDAVATVISSPLAVVGLFLLLVLTCTTTG